MACFACGGEISRDMIRIGRLVVLFSMAAKTQFRGVVIIAVMACGTIVGNGKVSAGQYIIIIMDGERCRFPAGKGGVTSSAIRGNIGQDMIWIY